jgi:sodium-coupled monocarboxylate transporter 8/12
MATFQALDYILFIGVLMISTFVGIYYIIKEKLAPKQSTSDDLLMGGREMAVFPVAMSLIASYMSAITVLGIPTEMYVFGAQYWLVALSGLMTYPVTCHMFLPFFHNMQLSSAYQVSPNMDTP